MKKIATALLSCALAAATLAGCAANAAQVPQETEKLLQVLLSSR